MAQTLGTDPFAEAGVVRGRTTTSPRWIPQRFGWGG